MKNSLSNGELRQHIEPFIYRDSAAPVVEVEAAPLPAGISEAESQARADQARRDAWSDAERTLGAELERRIGVERQAMLNGVREFAGLRQEYFRQLEREVVQLVLGIARKVLQREAQLDPLLLAGTVRVALDQLAAGTTVTLHVAATQMPSWDQLLQRELAGKLAPLLRADPALEPAGCRLETDTGISDFSLEAQLREVEQGFLDLLRRRELLSAAAPTP